MLAAIGVLALLLAALLVGALWLTIPGSNQIAVIPGLTGPVGVAFDADMVPRIQVTSEIDAAAALGFVHARDRMFQMELMRRDASGRLSEIAGPATLPHRPHDAHARIASGAPRPILPRCPLTPRSAGGLCPRRERVDRAARTVRRAGVPGAGHPRALDSRSTSLLWGKTMGLWLSMNWRQELSRQALAGKVPQQMIDELWPRRPSGAGPPDAMR